MEFSSYESEYPESCPSKCLNNSQIQLSVTLLEFYISNPLDTLKGEELKSKKTIFHCCRSLLVLESASLCPLENLVFFPSFPFLVILLSRDGGLRWWRPKWGIQFLWFTDMPSKVVSIGISDLY